MDDLSVLKGCKLSVCVDEALPDIIVVSYVHAAKIFRGVLLDSTKRHLPCGIPNVNPAFVGNNNNQSKSKPDDDVLYAANQRYAYMAKTNISTTTAAANRLKNNKIGKMTVRLRPRQVLCSKCKDICNDNSESVTRKRKAGDEPPGGAPHAPVQSAVAPPATITSPAKRSANAPVTRSLHAILQLDEKNKEKEVSHALSGNVNKLNIDNNKNKKSPLMAPNIPEVCEEEDKKLKRVILTRKKALNLSAINEKTPVGVVETTTSTRTIKICYGPQGEGTVLKIPAPAKIDLSDAEIDVPEENVVKATRKALKKAKKAKKKITLQRSGNGIMGSPQQERSIGSSSPRYTVGSASPRHGLGNNSPRFASMPPIPICEPTPKKRRHKMKHKKKHKDDRDRKHKDEDDKCLTHTQKLSINFKRLSGTYTTIINDQQEEEQRRDVDDDQEQESSSDEVPDFPPSPLRLKPATFGQNVHSVLDAEGNQLLVGDVVWGKLQGFPWWPGKISTLTQCDNGAGAQATVAWYGTATSSLVECDQLCPYLANFKIRYNKRKRGSYKEAIKQATCEARVLADSTMGQSMSQSMSDNGTAVTTSSSPSSMIMLVPPPLASPRAINVIS